MSVSVSVSSRTVGLKETRGEGIEATLSTTMMSRRGFYLFSVIMEGSMEKLNWLLPLS